MYGIIYYLNLFKYNMVKNSDDKCVRMNYNLSEVTLLLFVPR